MKRGRCWAIVCVRRRQGANESSKGVIVRTAKLVIGIISIVLFFVMAFQSCAAGLADAIKDDGGMGGAAGVVTSLAMLIAGIVGIATRDSKGGGITAGIFYLFGGLIGFANAGRFADLRIWGVLMVVFGIVFLIGSVGMKRRA